MSTSALYVGRRVRREEFGDLGIIECFGGRRTTQAATRECHHQITLHSIIKAVCRDHDRRARRCNRTHDLGDSSLGVDIDPGSRFVEQQYGRLLRNALRQEGALALPTRQGVNRCAPMSRKIDHVDGLADQPLVVSGHWSQQATGTITPLTHDVFNRQRQMRVNATRLQHFGDFAADAHASGRVSQSPTYHTKQRRLAGPIWAHHRSDTSHRHRNGYPVESEPITAMGIDGIQNYDPWLGALHPISLPVMRLSLTISQMDPSQDPSKPGVRLRRGQLRGLTVDTHPEQVQTVPLDGKAKLLGHVAKRLVERRFRLGLEQEVEDVTTR
jgi:hypothetical protein